MDLPTDVGELPATVALETIPVLAGIRRGASVPIDRQYLSGVEQSARALEDVCDGTDWPGTRIEHARRSKLLLETGSVQVEAFTERALSDASAQIQALAEELPAVQSLVGAYPGDALVVPEWLRIGNAVEWGIRLYFFGPDDAPRRKDILRANVEAVLAEDPTEFQRYQGRLHGYPDCCVEAFVDGRGDSPGPERRSVAPLAEHVREDALRSGRPASVDELVSGLLDDDRAMAFCAREFFPQPDCETARERGESVVATLQETVGRPLAADFVRLTYLLNYAVAETLATTAATGAASRPAPGSLGAEHVASYAPLTRVLELPRYQ